jgi:hypothetical protein
MSSCARVVIAVAVLVATGSISSCSRPEEASSASVTGDANPLIGVWEETAIITTGRDAANIGHPQPSLYIFTPTHYAMMGTLGDQPRADYHALIPTNDEKLAAFDSFWGNSGTYEINGDVLTIRPRVARMPNFMGGFERYQFHIDGNTLTLSFKSTDGNYRVSGKVVPDDRPFSETRTTLVRVK